MAARLRWGDAADDDDVLPPSTTTGPNDRGLITKVEYSRNAKGETVRRTTKIQVIKTETRVYGVCFQWCTTVLTLIALTAHPQVSRVQSPTYPHSAHMSCPQY